jgi:hypothetical protein
VQADERRQDEPERGGDCESCPLDAGECLFEEEGLCVVKVYPTLQVLEAVMAARQQPEQGGQQVRAEEVGDQRNG